VTRLVEKHGDVKTLFYQKTSRDDQSRLVRSTVNEVITRSSEFPEGAARTGYFL
jgi:hypothetical protein